LRDGAPETHSLRSMTRGCEYPFLRDFAASWHVAQEAPTAETMPMAIVDYIMRTVGTNRKRQLLLYYYFKNKNMKTLKKHRLWCVALLLAAMTSAHAQQNGSGNPFAAMSQPSKNTTELWVKNGDRNIYGLVSKPERPGKMKLAIISHGFGGTHHFGQKYFELLNSLGYMVYTFDFPCGSMFSRSDNNTLNMSVLDEAQDVKAIVDHFTRQADIDADSVVLVGESQGGLASALAAADLQDRINKLILVFPALCIPDDWNKRYPDEKLIPDTTMMWNVPIGRRYFAEAKKIDVYPAITRYHGPVLIVHGSKDAVVPVSYAEKAMKAYHNAHLGIIPGAGHGFKPEEERVSQQFIREFLEQ